MGLAVWCQDEAGPYQTRAYGGHSWQVQGQALRQKHEFIRAGTAKMLTLFRPLTGEVRIEGVERATNEVLHPWLKKNLQAILADQAAQTILAEADNQALWKSWQQDLRVKYTLPSPAVPLRMLLVWDNLVAHKSGGIILWLFEQGIMPLFTPIGGSWLNMAESIQRILVRRALDGTHPERPEEIIRALVGVARVWNEKPTPFVWGGKRKARRERAKLRRLGGSGAAINPLYRSAWQMTH